MLIFLGFVVIGGWFGLGEWVDVVKFELFSVSGVVDVIGWMLMGILFVSLI